MRAVDPARRSGLRRAAYTGLSLSTPCWLAPVWAASDRASPKDGAASWQDPASVMRWVQGAMTQRSFSGTYVVSAGGSMSSTRIVHICEGRTQVERIEALDGQARQVYRHNETVHVFWPATKEVSVEQRDFIRRFPLSVSPGEPAGLDMYELQESGQERLAGQDAVVLTFKARDSLRFAQRWWVDKRNGLLLRADTFGANGEVIESAAFSEIQLGTRLTAQQLIHEMNRLEGYRVRRPVMTTTELDTEGWAFVSPIAGFRPISTVRRQRVGEARASTETSSPLQAPAGTASLTAPPSVPTPLPAGLASMIQAIFSDGLTHISLFIEPYAARARKGERLVSTGATHALTRRVGEWWITAVGDVPADALTQFAAALERRRP